MELDPWVACPFDKYHRVPKSRIQAHIVKCQKNHPPLSTCPYNATHRVSKKDLDIHVGECPSAPHVESVIVEERGLYARRMMALKNMLERGDIPKCSRANDKSRMSNAGRHSESDNDNNEYWD